jgi:hypothetical protein
MQNLIMIFKMLPAIIAAIKALEEAIPGEGKGEQKLAALRQLLQVVDGSTKDLWPHIQSVVNVLVATMNAAGELKK